MRAPTTTACAFALDGCLSVTGAGQQPSIRTYAVSNVAGIDFVPLTAGKTLRNFAVATSLASRADSAGVGARFSTLHDGTSCVEKVLLTSSSKHLQIRKVNFNHRKIGQ